MLAIEYTYFRLRIPALNLAMPLLSFCQEWQTRLLSTFDPLPLSDSEKSILGAICYGYKQSLSPEMRQQFSMAGAAHILAVSGFHVGVVYSLLRTIAAVLSILFFYPRINEWLHLTELFNPIVQTAWQWLVIALAAQIGTLPLCFYYFGEVSSIALLSALPITLFSTCLIPISLLWSLLSLCGYEFPLLSSCITGLTHGFLGVIERMGQIPPFRFNCPYFIWFSPLLYLILIGACVYIKKREKKSHNIDSF